MGNGISNELPQMALDMRFLISLYLLFQLSYSLDVKGFDFQDNKAQRHVTGENGAAKITIKVREKWMIYKITELVYWHAAISILTFSTFSRQSSYLYVLGFIRNGQDGVSA